MCDLAFTATLEDFERSAFFAANKSTPRVGAQIVIGHGTRIYAATPTGVVIGNLPTKYNYLAACIRAGRSYVGRVTAAKAGQLAKITVDVAPK